MMPIPYRPTSDNLSLPANDVIPYSEKLKKECVSYFFNFDDSKVKLILTFQANAEEYNPGNSYPAESIR